MLKMKKMGINECNEHQRDWLVRVDLAGRISVDAGAMATPRIYSSRTYSSRVRDVVCVLAWISGGTRYTQFLRALEERNGPESERSVVMATTESRSRLSAGPLRSDGPILRSTNFVPPISKRLRNIHGLPF